MVVQEGGDGEPSYLRALRHEPSHLLGLDHVDDEGTLMHGSPSRSTWSVDDRRGLALAGRGSAFRAAEGGASPHPQPRGHAASARAIIEAAATRAALRAAASDRDVRLMTV